MSRSVVMTFASTIALALLVQAVAAGEVKVEVGYDRTVDFKAFGTWGWHPDGPGEVRMARTADDDREGAQRDAEPVITAAVLEEMQKRGLAFVREKPDAVVSFYLLLTTGSSSQTLGQFLPATPEWGLPPLTGATQSLEIVNQGSLVLDVSVGGAVVWRGVAKANVKLGADAAKRHALLREAVRDLVRRFPPRS
jgi:hypothetical protein